MRGFSVRTGMPRSALLAALGAIALWGVLAALSLRLRSWPPFLLVGAALLAGSLCSLHRVREWRVPVRVVVLGVYGLFGFHFLLFMALRLAPPVEANLVNYLWPLLIVLLAPAILPGTKLRARQVAGACAGFLGAALLVTGGEVGGGLGFDRTHAAGYALAIGSAIVWATYSLATKRMAAFPTASIGLACAVSGALALACHVLVEPRYVPAVAELPWLLALGLDPRRIGALAYLTPLLSTVVLVAIGAGEFSPATLVAIGLIVGGAAFGARG
jgi:drug/metabolite transporter (DMT)-like permease